MDLKKLFPLSYNKTLLVAIITYLVVGIVAGVIAVYAVLQRFGGYADLLSQLGDAVRDPDVAVILQILPGEAVGGTPRGIVDILVLGTIRRLDDIIALIGLCQHSRTNPLHTFRPPYDYGPVFPGRRLFILL